MGNESLRERKRNIVCVYVCVFDGRLGEIYAFLKQYSLFLILSLFDCAKNNFNFLACISIQYHFKINKLQRVTTIIAMWRIEESFHGPLNKYSVISVRTLHLAWDSLWEPPIYRLESWLYGMYICFGFSVLDFLVYVFFFFFFFRTKKRSELNYFYLFAFRFTMFYC
jgi:hypothetical protein